MERSHPNPHAKDAKLEPFLGKRTPKLIRTQIVSVDQSCTLLTIFSYF
jgi:hypothetical protein